MQKNIILFIILQFFTYTFPVYEIGSYFFDETFKSICLMFILSLSRIFIVCPISAQLINIRFVFQIKFIWIYMNVFRYTGCYIFALQVKMYIF